MKTRKFFTQQELDEARNKLENLPDLSPNRITCAGALDNLKDTILQLAKEKGYSTADIKSVLDAMQFGFSEKAISAIINEERRAKKRRLRKSETAQESIRNAHDDR